MVRKGFTRAYGTDLRKIIEARTKNRVHAFLSGGIVTALLQSSTATALLAISFARKNLMTLPIALAVMIGADISTTLVAQVLNFDLSWLAPVLLIAGILTHLSADKDRQSYDIGTILIGLGLMLLSLNLIRESALPLEASETLPLILQPLKNDTLLAIAVSALLTWIMHSSLAAVLFFASLAKAGLIDPALGFILVLGANIGGSLVPFAVTYSKGAIARQIAFGNIIMRGMLAVLLTLFAGFIPVIIEYIPGDASRQIVNIHTGFNILLALLFLPFVELLARACRMVFKEETNTDDKDKPLYLDEHTLDTPSLAISGAARETLRIAELAQDMFFKTMAALESGDTKLIAQIRRTDNQLDFLYAQIKLFITRLSKESMNAKEAGRVIQILTFATNIEHIGDIIDKSLMELAEKKVRKKENFSAEGLKEIRNMHAHVLNNLKHAQSVFMSSDPELARRLISDKNAIRQRAEHSSEQHFERLKDRHSASLATSSLHLDIIRDFRRINSYATRVAFAVEDTEQKDENK